MKEMNDDDVEELGVECEQVDPSYVAKKLESVQLKLKEHVYKEQEGKVFWTIEVHEKGTKPYTIERAFSEFKWLVQSLRNRDISVFVPSVGQDGAGSYVQNKLMRDEKHLRIRRDGLERFLRKLEDKPKVLSTEELQIFLNPDRKKFEYYQNIYNQKYGAEAQGISRLIKGVTHTITSIANKGVVQTFTNKQKEQLEKIYKNKFTDVQGALDKVVANFTAILQSHTSYLDAMKQFQPDLVAEDEKYNEQLDRLKRGLQLLKKEILEIRVDAARFRSREQLEHFKQQFDKGLKPYQLDIRNDIKYICSLLNELNQRTSEALQKGLQSKLVIEL